MLLLLRVQIRPEIEKTLYLHIVIYLGFMISPRQMKLKKANYILYNS